MTTVALSGYLLDETLTELESLASTIESARTSAQRAVPYQVSVPTLSTSGVLGAVPEWLREQKIEPITVMRDLAYLLDNTGSTVEFTSTGADLVHDAKTEIGNIYADRFEDIDDIDSSEDREAMMHAFEMFEAYADDPVVSAAMLEKLGPEGLNDAFYDLQGLISYDWNEPNYNVMDKQEEVERLKEMQDMGASVLAMATASASSAGLLDDDFGRDFVDNDARGWGVSTLFQYADKTDSTLGTDFLVDAGEAILQREREQGGPDSWHGGLGGPYPPLPFGTDDGDDAVMNDPGLQWLQALDSNPQASQQILSDTENADYLLGERRSIYEDPQGAAAGEVLRAATVDLAFDGTDAESRTAAEIASHVVDHFGGDGNLLDGADEEVAAMLSTYMADVDRVVSRADDGESGIYGDPHPSRPDWLQDGDVPAYGIMIDSSDLTGLLKEIGDTDGAVTVLGETATRYNQVRLRHGTMSSLAGGEDWAEQTDGDPLVKAIQESSAFQGHLIDALINGDIDNEQDLKKQRDKLAAMFSLPLDYVTHVPGVGKTVSDILADPVGKFIFGNIKQSATDAYSGDGVSDAMRNGNEMWGTTRNSLRLQVLHEVLSASTSDSSTNEYTQTQGGETRFSVPDELRDAWPTVGGRPVPVGELSEDDVRLILDESEQADGYAGLVGTGVDNSFASLTEHWSGN